MAANGNKTSVNISKNNPRAKSIEETYQKRSQHHHILLRPDTYIGSNVKKKEKLWIYEEDKMVKRAVTYVPGLYKIFDEILVNAADNKRRDPSMNLLKVEIDVGDNLISVYNSGEGIPVVIHEKEKVYVPEMIFGQLLTSSNYDDNTKKTTGGRNGFGAKLTNIFSTEFIVETADGKRQRKYKQIFSNNMNKISPPIITECQSDEKWTRISFRPDLAKFQMDHLEADVVALMKKRVFDLAGCLGKTVEVILNGKKIPVESFLDYVNLYLESELSDKQRSNPRFVKRVNDRWEICICVREGHFEQVSFVNAIATMKGGTHVDHVTDQLVDCVIDKVYTANPNINVEPHFVKNHFWVFVNALIDNPSFNSQTKMSLTTSPADFGSTCILTQDLLEEVCRTGVVDSLISWADYKQKREQKKAEQEKRRRITGIPKLEDANEAGGAHGNKCTLILTEGDSAKALAMAGIPAVGRDHYGVFPLRGKLLNVRDTNEYQIQANTEIQSIQKILGLNIGMEYESVESLRYGHLMIMTDQDHDGSHIKGLLINLFHSQWPSLLKIPSFLLEFITPIVKVTHKSGQILSFYSMPEYETWKQSLGGNTVDWSIKYYKGLGTSTSKEGKEYFQDLEKHKKNFLWVDKKDGDAIELAFSKNKIEARKKWLQKFKPGTYLDQKEKHIRYRDFVNKELIQFSVADLQRSIPSMVDGFKPGQRKILFSCFKRNFIKEAKVAQFSGYVSEHSSYHHGEQSLANTIVGMAQDYVGSNNINLLQPNGQFGTRHQGGKDHASARYIYTCLSPITRFLFHKNDDPLLHYLNEDGQSVEPIWYMPIIPMVLVNGSEGIGTGWSTYIPNYNPRDIVTNVRHFLNGEPMKHMIPWYKGFKGRIERIETKSADESYMVSGIIEEMNKTTVRIRELPIRKSSEEYKEFLDSHLSKGGIYKDQFIKDYKESNDDKTVHFEVYLSEKNLAMAKQEGLMKKFKLTTTISTSNMHMFDPKGVLKKYSTPEKVIEEFCELRLEFYEKRKKVMLTMLESDLLKLENKVRFIQGVIEGKIIIMNRKQTDLLLELKLKNFTPFPRNATGATTDTVTKQTEKEYDYLLSMPIGTLTMEKVEELCAHRKKLSDEVVDLKNATPKTLWLKDLDALERELNLQSKIYDRPEEMINEGSPTVAVKNKVPKKTVKARKNRVKNASKADIVAKQHSDGKGLPLEAGSQDVPARLKETKENPASIKVNEGKVLQQEKEQVIKSYPTHKSTETKSSIVSEAPVAGNTEQISADNLNKSIIEISETGADCKNKGQETILEIEISDTEVVCEEKRMNISRIKKVADNDNAGGHEKLGALVTSVVEWGMNESVHDTSRENLTRHIMITRKRSKENNQHQLVASQLLHNNPNGNVLKAVENIIASPEKKLRKTSSFAFGKKQRCCVVENAQKKKNYSGVCSDEVN